MLFRSVMKPPDEDVPAATPSIKPDTSADNSSLTLKPSPEDESKLRMSRTTSTGRRSRDDVLKDLNTTPSAKEAPPPPATQPEHVEQHRNAESARVLATERLRLQAETAQNSNIVMELSLDADHFIWVNYAWRNVVG